MTAVKSILDTDLYKLSMSYAYFSLYPLANRTPFDDRGNDQISLRDISSTLRKTWMDGLLR